MTAFTPNLTTQSFPVYSSCDFRVVSGANEGDGISFANDLMLDDIYRLNKNTRVEMVTMNRAENGTRRLVRRACESGPSAELHLDSTVTLMDGSSLVTEALVLVDVDTEGHAQNVYILPLAPLNPDAEYRLVGIAHGLPDRKLAQLACVSFAKGTHITLASGTQRRIEDLSPGDAVLTRDDGVRPIRWIGQTTQRAYGEFAPIRIASGALNNAKDLVLSPDHRLFVYQRAGGLGSGRPELLIKARDLVNGTTVRVLQGGFIEYYQLLFDSHQIIFAEGIAAETMLVGADTPKVPDIGKLDARVVTPIFGRIPPAVRASPAKYDRHQKLARLRAVAGG